MKYRNLIAIDIAKNVFQILVMKKGKIVSNRQMTRAALICWLAKQQPTTVVMEACAGSHYWVRLAKRHGHDAWMINAKRVKQFRQGQKTDFNDVAAICDAAQSHQTVQIHGMSAEEQGLQSVDRMRSLLIKQRTKTMNTVRGLLSEFGVLVAPGMAAFRRRLMEILQEKSDEIPLSVHQGLSRLYQHYLNLDEACEEADKSVQELVKLDEVCQRISQLEGMGPIGTIKVRAKLRRGDFKNGRQFAACVGATPRQHSSGEKIHLGSICHRTACDSDLRSTLYLGAWSLTCRLKTRQPRTTKECWLKELLDRVGVKRAAIALVNKNMRTVFAMYKNNTAYQATPLVA